MTLAISIQARRAGTRALAAATVAMTDMLQAGQYDVWADVDIAIAVGTYPKSQGASVNDPNDVRTLTQTTGYRIAAGNVVPVIIPSGDDCVIGFIAAGVGNAFYHKVG